MTRPTISHVEEFSTESASDRGRRIAFPPRRRSARGERRTMHTHVIIDVVTLLSTLLG
ncbi:hypothetical protein [Saccharothrix australiensis]|uniref:hypothetical protein n=1 Tax=Saccharothrix australiensis TaxID=2072 RepID=UPI001476F874|nr:hypothetical protein [Saccharothrix australiensis]